MNCRRIVGALTACSILTATPASAGDAETVLLGAILGNMLGGKTELGNNAGQIEETMLGSRLLMFAAEKLVGDKGELKGETGIMLVGEEEYNLGLPGELVRIMDWHNDQLTGCAGMSPPPPRRRTRGSSDTDDSGPADVVSDAIGKAPAPSTNITGYQLTVADSALIAAFQSPGGAKWKRISDVSHIDSASNTVATKWADLRLLRAKADTNGCSKTDEGKARVARFDQFSTQVTELGEKGAPSILFEAERIQQVYRDGGKILRLRVEAMGGSIINSDNLLTRLGMPAVSLTGATVISYRLIDPRHGTTEKSGLMICTAPKQSLGGLQKGKPSDTSKFKCALNGKEV